MKGGTHGFLAALVACFLCIALCPWASAQAEPPRAEELTASAKISATGGTTSVLTDGRESSYTTIPGGGSVTVTAGEGISSLYVLFDRIYGPWSLSAGSAEVTCGENGFLHE